jgi:exosortase
MGGSGAMRGGWWIGVLAVVFAPALLALARGWLAHDYYSHGFLVPLVAFWMFRTRRDRLPAPGSHPLGLLVVIAMALLYALGFLRVDPTLQGLALVGAVAGVVVERWGRAGLRTLWLPVAFLLFMVPIPPSLLSPAITWLQLTVSAWAVEVLHVCGYSVLREGNVVLLPGDQRLFVAEACSGITSIVTLLPLGVVLAAFTQPSRLRGLLLVAAVIPIAMLGNLIRVIGTVAGADAFGVPAVTSGTAHEAAGLLTFALSCLLLIGLGALLRRGSGARQARPSQPA